MLKDIWDKKSLSPAVAGKLFGRLLFNSSQYYGRYGRALLRAFKRRQHEKSRLGWNRQLEAACAFWVPRLAIARPREIPVRPSDIPLVVSYSDGEGTGGVGCAIWAPGGVIEGGYMRTPHCVRALWTRQTEICEEHFDILEVEAIGPVIVLETWPHLVQGRLWLHFIDNANALSALVKGGSSVHSADCIAAWVSGKLAELGVMSWFDRVDTKSNPVDGLSRQRFEGPWKMVQLRFPPTLRRDLKAYLDER